MWTSHLDAKVSSLGPFHPPYPVRWKRRGIRTIDHSDRTLSPKNERSSRSIPNRPLKRCSIDRIGITCSHTFVPFIMQFSAWISGSGHVRMSCTFCTYSAVVVLFCCLDEVGSQFVREPLMILVRLGRRHRTASLQQYRLRRYPRLLPV